MSDTSTKTWEILTKTWEFFEKTWEIFSKMSEFFLPPQKTSFEARFHPMRKKILCHTLPRKHPISAHDLPFQPEFS